MSPAMSHALQVDITKEGLDLGEGEEEKKASAEQQAAFAPLGEWLKRVLGEGVESVVVSSRVSAAPCMLVTSKFGWSANMERIMKSQTMGDARAMEYMRGKKIMEVNPDSEIMQGLKAAVAAGTPGPEAEATAQLMYQTALLSSGFTVEDPAGFAQLVFELMRTKAAAGSGADQANGPGTTQKVDAEIV